MHERGTQSTASRAKAQNYIIDSCLAEDNKVAAHLFLLSFLGRLFALQTYEIVAMELDRKSLTLNSRNVCPPPCMYMPSSPVGMNAVPGFS